jgi:uroporphyrinogen decarboxylase
VAASMTKRQRLEATFAGQPVDRVAVALWRHFPGDDQRPADLAAATLAWQRQYDWDFIKVSPSSSFCLVDWGVEDVWLGGDEGTREYTRHVIQRPEDWTRLSVLDPTKGFLGGQLHCLEMIRDGVKDEVPYIQTIFSPLAQAKNLAGGDRLLVHLREAPEAVHAGLQTITQTTIAFLKACQARGIAGIYYALQFATYRLLSADEHQVFGAPYDLRILAAAGECWFNMLHLHGSDIMFDQAAAYPFYQAINWHDRETAPSLGEGLRRSRAAVCGGLARWEDLLRGTPDGVRAQVTDAIRQTGGRRLIVASGCVAPVNAPFSNLRAVRESVEGA